MPVDAETIKAALAVQDVAIRDYLLALPHGVANRVLDASLKEGVAGVARELTAAIRGALRGLASAKAVPAPR